MPAGASEDCAEPAGSWYSYAVIQVVPRVERGELLNVGIILFVRTLEYLAAQIELSEQRLGTLAPSLDMVQLKQHLTAFEAIASGDPSVGPIATSPPSERFHWLTSPRSTVLQTSAVHVGWCSDPAQTMEDLLTELVR